MQQIITIEKYLNQKCHKKASHWEKNSMRFLIPFELLNTIWNQYLIDNILKSSIKIESNIYAYEIHDNGIVKWSHNFRFHIHIENDNDNWDKLITLYNDFVVSFSKDDMYDFITVSPLGMDKDKNDYMKIQNQLMSFEFEKLSAYKSKHFNDFMAMLLIHNILKSANTLKYSSPHLDFDFETGDINIAKSDNAKHRVLYAFNKIEADSIAKKYTVCSPKNDIRYHIVYFVNTDFENFGQKNIVNDKVGAVSVKALMSILRVPLKEWIKYELAILYLTYNHNQEYLDWINPYAISYFKTRIEENAIKTKDFEPISDSLFQDALNTLSTSKHLYYFFDYFLFVSAANLVNRKFRDILDACKNKSKEEYFVQKNKIDGCKKHIFDIFRSWMKEKPKGIYICLGHIYNDDGSLSDDVTVLINMKVFNRRFQFRFRMKGEGSNETEYMQELVTFAKANGIRLNGEDSGIYLQPIAQTLYQYAYLLKLGMK